MRILYFDCSAGAAGDMILASMLNLDPWGEKELGSRLGSQLKKMPLEGYGLSFQQVQKKGLQALQMTVDIQAPQPLRHYPEIEAIIKSASYSPFVEEKSLAVFQALARAEARVHGVPEDRVHFHEVGAVDSILDIVGCMLTLEQLKVQDVRASALPLGKGWAITAHGMLPLPAPATVEIIKNHGIPCYGTQVQGETVTPSGAAILAVICSGFTPLPPLRLESIGCGAGHMDFEYPNVLRVFQGVLHPGTAAVPGSESADVLSTEPARLLEANIDDSNPEWFEHVLHALLDAGALDVWLTPIQMKKNRPAIKLTVLARPEDSHRLGQIVLRETTTLGYRQNPVEKIMLPREERLVTTPWGKVRVKLAGKGPDYWNVKPEYQDCLEIARKHQVPLKNVYQAVWKNLDN